MLTHPTLDQLRALKLDGMAQAFVELETQEDVRNLAHAEWLALLLDRREAADRNTRRFQTRLRAAPAASQSSLDRGHRLPRAAPARQSPVPAAGHLPLDRRSPQSSAHRSVRRRQVVVILCAGAKSLPRRLYRSLCPRAAPVADLDLAHGDGRFARLFRMLVKVDLLVLDDWGPDRLSASQRRDLMEIVEDRYGRGSILITSQLPAATWHEVIGEPTLGDAILDRIVHNAYRLELDGPSMRKIKASEETVSTSSPVPTPAADGKPTKGAKK